MANPFSNTLFHYVPGNHELGKGPTDEEITANKIGSNNFRPYYSFDYKGIHFISLPQLLDTILVNRESLDWLSHDLSINKHKSTLIFSHNSIKNTTFDNGENGYRTVVNSEALLKIINKYNNVIAWFHGHNHQYEIVKKHNRLYVSNGRIGGFNPPDSWGNFGQGHLGGIYFEVRSTGLLVKCYSATKNTFLDQLGYSNLTKKLSLTTSFDNSLGLNYYFGHGSLTNNVSYEVINHYLSHKDVKINIRELESTTLNDNSSFELTTELFFIGKRIKRIIGYQLLPRDLERRSVKNGLLIEKNVNKRITINLPTQKKTKLNYMVRGSYFRCESKDEFNAGIKYKSNFNDTKPSIMMSYRVYSKEQVILFDSEKIHMNKLGKQFFTESIKIPILNEYEEKYLRVSFDLIDFPKEFVLTKLSLSKEVNTNKSQSIEINEIIYSQPKNNLIIKQDEYQKQGTSSIKYYGKKPVSCLIKIKDVEWQIRNAISTYEKNKISLIAYRHQYQSPNEVILKPIQKQDFYLNRVIDLMPLKISYTNRNIKIQLIKTSKMSRLVFIINKRPKNIYGSKNYHIKGNMMVVVPETKNIEVFF
jgi:hypothetical protein